MFSIFPPSKTSEELFKHQLFASFVCSLSHDLFNSFMIIQRCRTAVLWLQLPEVMNLRTPRSTIYKWLFQLDDEPNLYIGNGWASPNIHFLMVVWGSRYIKHMTYHDLIVTEIRLEGLLLFFFLFFVTDNFFLMRAFFIVEQKSRIWGCQARSLDNMFGYHKTMIL